MKKKNKADLVKRIRIYSTFQWLGMCGQDL